MTAVPFLQFSSKKQASDWLALGEAIVNNNNSLVVPIRGLLFGGKIGGKELLSPSTTLNLQTCSARTGKLIAVPLPISYLYAYILAILLRCDYAEQSNVVSICYDN